MAHIMRLVEHIRTSAGARFSIYENDEDRRVQLIQYYNEVHADSGGDLAGDFEDDADLDDVVDAIEEIEDVSCEEIYIPANEVLEPRERDTALAALRYWQRTVPLSNGKHLPEWEIAINDHDKPLTAEEIDDLCERINV